MTRLGRDSDPLGLDGPSEDLCGAARSGAGASFGRITGHAVAFDYDQVPGSSSRRCGLTRQIRAHTKEVVERMPGLVQTLGALVLFASGKQMREVYALLLEDLRRCTPVQGSMPNMDMLARHRAAIGSSRTGGRHSSRSPSRKPRSG